MVMGPYEKAVEDISDILGDYEYDYSDDEFSEEVRFMCIEEYTGAILDLYGKLREIKDIINSIGGV